MNTLRPLHFIPFRRRAGSIISSSCKSEQLFVRGTTTEEIKIDFLVRGLSSASLVKKPTSEGRDEVILNKGEDGHAYPPPPDDKAFFKRLGKTVNHYWRDNAKEVISRLDIERLVDPRREEGVKENLRRRYCDDKVNLQKIRELWKGVKNNDGGKGKEEEELVSLALWVPNDTHPKSLEVEGDVPVPIKVCEKEDKGFKVLEFQKYCDKHNLLHNDNLGNVAYPRSYFLKGPLAQLEDALIRYALEAVKKAGFQLISVPDILYPHVIESCGMRTRSDRDQVFWVEIPSSPETEVCLSGTAEMSIGGSLQNQIIPHSSLPLKLCSVSRCFRAETSSVEEERGLYRVHEFTKVELFGVTPAESGNEGSELHEEIRKIEESFFSSLGISFQTLEMPPSELGLPASRKFDIEAWMPGRKLFGEISSCSNCTDYQSRRLNIRYRSPSSGELKFVHTVNGTAVAIPRMLITLIETCQREDGSVKLPEVLEAYFGRSWEESLESFRKQGYKPMFMRTKGTQMKYTKGFRTLELQ